MIAFTILFEDAIAVKRRLKLALEKVQKWHDFTLLVLILTNIKVLKIEVMTFEFYC